MKLLRRLFKIGWNLVAFLFWSSLYILPLIVFATAMLTGACTWSVGWIVLVAAMGTAQMFLIGLLTAYVGSGYYIEKRWMKVWNDYFSRWQQVAVVKNQILEGMFDMISFIYKEQCRRKEAFEFMLKDIGLEPSDDMSIPEGMEDFCRKAKF